MLDFQVRSTSEMSFITEWMDDSQESFDLLRIKTKEIATKYLDFVNTFWSVNGIEITYDEFDADTFEYDVVKWCVSLSVGDSDGFTEKLKSVSETDYYHVIKTDNNEVLHFGTITECYEYVAEHFPRYTANDEENENNLTNEIKIEYRNSKQKVTLK